MKYVKRRVKLIGSGTSEDPNRVNFPTYEMVPNSELPKGSHVGNKDNLAKTVEVMLPEAYFKAGKSVKDNIRAMYAKQAKWDNSTYDPEKELE